MAQDSGLTSILLSAEDVERTIDLLREYGERRSECVVLWLGRQVEDAIEVFDVYCPIQEVSSHTFHIPPAGMDELRKRLRANRLMVAAQVHTHPEEAFHSEADDHWAIVRHRGALSLVVPWFAARTSAHRFLDDAKIFSLSAIDEWTEMSYQEVTHCIQVS